MFHRSFERRSTAYRVVSIREWEDWGWQQRHAVRSLDDTRRALPVLPPGAESAARAWQARGLRFALTPYMLALIDQVQGAPVADDPLWRQFFPIATSNESRPDEYTPCDDNWEDPREMLTPICHWKYDNRAIVYLTDSCLAYCSYCLRSLQSNDPREKHGGLPHWEDSVAAIAARPEIEEVIFSGGDPLLLSNDRLGALLADVGRIPTVRVIRIHTRAWTHNPFRLDEEFAVTIAGTKVREMAVHVTHPRELTVELDEALGRLRQKHPGMLFLAQIPLIKGVNDCEEVLRELFMGLYCLGVKPYYLLHIMPNVPAAAVQRTSVRKGVALMRALKRRISNPAMPEYIIVHNTGKQTVPLEPQGTPEFQYATASSGHPIIRFKNWRGNWEEYLDGIDAATV